MKKITIREEYEAIAGSISDRQWRRIKRRLKISDSAQRRELIAALKMIRTYAALRLTNGRRLITLEDCKRHEWLGDFIKGLSCSITGRQIVKVFQLLKPIPSDATIRRWGYEIDCPLYLEKWYGPEETRKWIAKVATQTKFKFPTDAIKER